MKLTKSVSHFSLTVHIYDSNVTATAVIKVSGGQKLSFGGKFQ